VITADDLKDVPVFACLDEAERVRLAARAADLRLRNGDWLFREGEQTSFYVLLEGRVKLFKRALGHDKEITEYKLREFFGEVPILLGAPSFASAKSVADGTRVVAFEPQMLRELIQTSAPCSALIMQTMTNRLSYVQQYAAEMPSARVLVVGSQYDLDCREIRNFLTMNRIPYEWIDREREPDRVPSCMPADLSGPAVVVDRSYCVGQPPTVRKVAEALGLRTAPKQKEHEVYDVVIVGGGPAGLAAAVYGASEGLCVLMVERNAAGGQAGTSSRIENYLGFPSGISGDDLSERAVQQANRFGAEIVLAREVKNIFPIPMEDNRGGYCVELDGGERVRAKAVILATGVDWRRLEAEGVDRLIGRGVLYGAARTEASTVIGKDVFIVGGGNSAGQAAMFFSNYANSVTVVVRGAGLSMSMSQYLIEQIGSKSNIKVEPYSHVVSVGGADHLETICTQKEGEELQTRKADALFVLIGADAATDWLPKNLERDERGYVCTGRDLLFLAGGGDSPDWKGRRAPYLLETNLPGLFCVGDVRHDSIKRVSSGVGEGSMAIAFVHQYLAQRDGVNDNL
jgi:thioredoxin reductase (NADPH)